MMSAADHTELIRRAVGVAIRDRTVQLVVLPSDDGNGHLAAVVAYGPDAEDLIGLYTEFERRSRERPAAPVAEEGVNLDDDVGRDDTAHPDA